MILNDENKAHIDGLSYEGLLRHWRFAAAGDPWFHGETGKYWSDRMNTLRAEDNALHVQVSKKLGWGKP